MLVLNVIIFWIPRQLWKLCEGGLIKSFAQESTRSLTISVEKETAEYVHYFSILGYTKVRFP